MGILDEMESLSACDGALVNRHARVSIKRLKIPSYLAPGLACEMASQGSETAANHLNRINAGRAMYRFIPIEVID